MARPEKVQAVADITKRVEEANAVFLTEYAGLSVKQQQELRRGLRAQDAEIKVVKMTLARRATEALDLDELHAMLSGPTALTFADGDAVAAAKVLRDFSKEHAALVIKGGLLAGELIAPERVSQLADIEPREVLLARIAGAFQAPMAQTAGLLGALLRNTASVVQQLIERREAAGETAAPVGEPAAEDAAAEPAAEAAPEEAAAEAAPEEAAAEPEAGDDGDGTQDEAAAQAAEADDDGDDTVKAEEPEAEAAGDSEEEPADPAEEA